MNILLYIFLAIILNWSISWSAIYFIDDTEGDDKIDGLSQSTPWKSISKVNSYSFLPGDIVKFKRGGVWRETLVPKTSGTGGEPIVFEAFGEGPAPKFLGSDSYNGVMKWTK